MIIRAALAAWHYIFGSGDQPAAASRTVGGRATPAARTARLAAGRGAERTPKRLPSCSISVSVNDSRSAMISGQELVRPSATMRSTSAFFSTSARKLQNTWPRMVSSNLWKIGVESRCLAVRKSLLHHPQLLVAEHGFEWVEIGVGTQHEDAVELLLLLDLVGVDREVLVADRLQVAPKAGVADQRLVALGELALQRGHDRGTVGGVLLRLLAVATDDVASPRQQHRLRLVIDLLAALLHRQRHDCGSSSRRPRIEGGTPPWRR